MNPLPVINSHNSWSPLEEVWLGDVYPCEWYDHLDSEIRDVFHRLTDITKQDLEVIENKLKSFGVTVYRPEYKNMSDYVDIDGQLDKPQITPRDHFVVIGNQLIGHEWHFKSWQHAIDKYCQDKSCEIVYSKNPDINGANVVRIGQDLIIDRNGQDFSCDFKLNDDYAIHMTDNGGHIDGCFAILKPGLLIANHYWDSYDSFFPDWHKIFLTNATFSHPQGIKPKAPTHNGKFWDTGIGSNRSFNQHVIKHALDWVGCYTETFFELNCLSLDEHNVMMLGYNSNIEHQLKSHGITVHWVPFRTRSFWDGGMHCLTVDIRRNSKFKKLLTL